MNYDFLIMHNFCAFSESGRVFMFGPNDWGQLGIGLQKVANRPKCIKSEFCLKICGEQRKRYYGGVSFMAFYSVKNIVETVKTPIIKNSSHCH